MNNDSRHEVKEVGVFTPKMFAQAKLNAGDVGYVHREHQDDRRHQDRRHHHRSTQSGEGAAARLPGNPSDGVQRDLPDQHRRLRAPQSRDRQAAAERRRLHLPAGKLTSRSASDSAAASSACCTWRSSRSGSGASTTWTSSPRRPSVVYEVLTTRGETMLVDNPAHLPDPSIIEEIREPIVKAYVLCPNENIGDLLQLIMEKRGTMDHTETLDTAPRHAALRAAAERNPRRLQRQD